MSGTLAELAQLADADLERRFGGLRRLYGESGYACVRQARVAVVGIGGVGSWAAEALARSGVASLVLVDMDHVSESNVNRQIHALTPTLGQAKVQAMQERIALIHPGCEVVAIDEFIDDGNAAALLDVHRVDGVIDCCDQVRAKAALAAWAWAAQVPLVTVGAAGGKLLPHRLEVADLSEVTHDPLLASLRQRLRQHHEAPRRGSMNLHCVFSREAVKPPQDASCAVGDDASSVIGDGSLNCHGYGSSVTVTATFGMVAAAELLNALIAMRLKKTQNSRL